MNRYKTVTFADVPSLLMKGFTMKNKDLEEVFKKGEERIKDLMDFAAMCSPNVNLIELSYKMDMDLVPKEDRKITVSEECKKRAVELGMDSIYGFKIV